MVEFFQDCWHERDKVLHAVTQRLDHQNGNGQGRQVLLKRKVLVHRQKDVEPRCGERQKFSVLDAGPSAARNGEIFVPYQQSPKPARKVFVKQDAHLG